VHLKPITEAKPAWARGGVAAICEKCTNVRFPEEFPQYAGDERLNLKGYLKDRLKAEGRWGPIRVITSSCLDVCARGGVTVMLDPLGNPERGAQCLVIDPLTAREELYDAIVERLSPVEETTPA
jgi:hypothetical protein